MNTVHAVIVLASIIFPTGNSNDVQDVPLEIYDIVGANLGTNLEIEPPEEPPLASLSSTSSKRQRPSYILFTLQFTIRMY